MKVRLAVAALLSGAVLTACGGGSSGDDQALVVQECKDSVQAQLTYDADFPFFDSTPNKDASGTWHDTGSVKAQNGFGAQQTLRWTCTVDRNGSVQASVS